MTDYTNKAMANKVGEWHVWMTAWTCGCPSTRVADQPSCDLCGYLRPPVVEAPDPRPSTTAMHFTPALMKRLEAIGVPGDRNIAEWLVSEAEAAKKMREEPASDFAAYEEASAQFAHEREQHAATRAALAQLLGAASSAVTVQCPGHLDETVMALRTAQGPKDSERARIVSALEDIGISPAEDADLADVIREAAVSREERDDLRAQLAAAEEALTVAGYSGAAPAAAIRELTGSRNAWHSAADERRAQITAAKEALTVAGYPPLSLDAAIRALADERDGWKSDAEVYRDTINDIGRAVVPSGESWGLDAIVEEVRGTVEANADLRREREAVAALVARRVAGWAVVAQSLDDVFHAAKAGPDALAALAEEG